MKILFICGSLEAGRDGVGDYTRRLAGELFRTGHTVGIIALNDTHTREEFYGLQESAGISIPVLRVPSHWTIGSRFERARQWVDELDPEWLSLQFVPFAFQPKGLLYTLIKPFQKLGGNRRWHILFHELWLGMHVGASGKESIWGFIQKKMIMDMVSKLKPGMVHTQSGLYKAMLAKSNVDAQLLPLFSNIPFIQNKESGAHGISAGNQSVGDKKIMVLFGELHDNNTPIIQFAREVKAYSDKTGILFSLIILGRNGNERLKWKDAWYKEGMDVILSGEQSEEEISKVMQIASFGLTTTVYHKVDKSGSVAAMAEHGLDIICVSGPWQPKRVELSGEVAGINEYKEGNLESLLSRKKSETAFSNLTDVAQKMISSLEMSK